jgi:hypothetical protein
MKLCPADAEPLPASAVPIEEAARPLIAVALYVAGFQIALIKQAA